MPELTRHRCMVYDADPAAQLPLIASIARDHLVAGYRCFYLHSPSMVAQFRSCLGVAGLDTAQAEERGALILSSDQSHLENGVFEPDRMLSKLRQAVRQATAEGFAGLWASGDMLWEFGSEKNLSKLLTYEVGVEELLEEEPALRGICQYHRGSMTAQALEVALFTHRTVHVNEILTAANPYFHDMQTFRSGGQPPAAHVDAMLGRLHTCAR